MGTDGIVLVGRILLTFVFFLGGYDKITNISGTAEAFAGFGVPMPAITAWVSGVFELVAAVFILIGFQTRITAWLLAAFCIASGYLGHYGQGGDDPMLVLMNWQSFQKNIAMAGGFLVLAAYGPGRLSVDERNRAA